MNLFGLSRRKSVSVDVASTCRRGLVRPDNQDRLLVSRRNCVFCVADGMGGGEDGAKASEIVCSSLSERIVRRTDFAACIRLVESAFAAADARIRAYAASRGHDRMATTATVLVLDAESGASAVVGNVGDSRVYRFRDGALGLLTRDHTVVNLLRGGNASAAALGRRSSLAHVLTRAVGVGPSVSADWRKLEVRDRDAFLVCSDGVHDMVDDAALRGAFAAGGNASAIVERIAGLVTAAGAADNFSAIVVRVRRVR